MGDRRDPGAAAVLRASGVRAGAVATLARPGHRVRGPLARELILLLAQEFPDRCIHTVGDAAYHGRRCWSSTPPSPPGARPTPRCTHPPTRHRQTRPPPVDGPPAGQPGRDRRGRDLAAGHVSRYGRRDTVEITVIDAIWYGAFGNTEGRTVLVASPVVKRAWRISPPNHQWHRDRGRPLRRPLADRGRHRRRQTTARHRPGPQPAAARGGAHRATELVRLQPRRGLGPCTATTRKHLTGRRADQAWYSHKDDIAFEDMRDKLRRSLVEARITGIDQLSPIPVNTATTNWPARQPPRNCESQDIRMTFKWCRFSR